MFIGMLPVVKAFVFSATCGVVLTNLAFAGQAVDFTLTRDGKPAATIVTAAEPTVAAAFAARELQDHVKRISGAVLPIASDQADVAGPRILIGQSKPSRALSLPVDQLKSQEYMIRFLSETLVLLGKEQKGGDDCSRPRRAAGRVGRALQFDGVRNQIRVATCGFDDERGTLEAWVWMPRQVPETHATILRIDSSSPWTYHILQRDMKSSCISYATYDGKQVQSVASGDLAAGWHHVVATHDAAAGKMELFLDGASVGTTRYAKTACKDASLSIGGIAGAMEGAAVGNPFRGCIDEIRISNVVRNIKDAAGGPYEPDEHTRVLLHCDEAAGPPQNSVVGLVGAYLPGFYGENGTLYAVYDFLERFCDVRWYAPGEIGRVCPRKPTLVVHAADVRRGPAMIYRWMTPCDLYLPGPPRAVPPDDATLWKLRMRIGGHAFWVCHSFYGYYDRFLKTHPDWFAEGYSGQPPQMCYTNPEFIRQVVQDARDYFDGRGAKTGATAVGDVFGLVPMDDCSWCKCPRCQALLNRAEAKNQQFTNGKASDYVFSFVNKVAREVRKTHPDKWIGALAYSDYGYYPVKERVEPNVVVQMCLHTRNWWCPAMEANDSRVLSEWRNRDPSRPLYLWLYYCMPALPAHGSGFHYFPGYFAHTIVRQMKLFREAKIQGIFMEHSSECGESYLMDQLELYVTLKLADDPTLDGDQLIDEFFRRYYGAAAEPMKQLYGAMEATYSDPKNYPVAVQKTQAHQHQTAELARFLCTTERMARFADLLSRAKQTARTPEEKQRVEWFERGQWDYITAGGKH
jgi:hypothetical protein